MACSAGSACHAVSVKPADNDTTTHTTTEVETKMSHVLASMHVDPAFAFGTLRLSFGRHTTLAEINKAVVEIHKVVNDVWEKANK